MSPEKLKSRILSLVTDITFTYNGKPACINPWNKNKFEVGFADSAKEYNDIDELMNDCFFDGKPLSEICITVEFD